MDNFIVPFGIKVDGSVCSINFSSSDSPHLLIAGTTGSGKSVVLETILYSSIHYYNSKELEIRIIDPKGNELIDFEDEEHVEGPNGCNADDAIETLSLAVEEMDNRYDKFTNCKTLYGKAAKSLSGYNRMCTNKVERIPRWLIVLDEYADLVEEDPSKKKTIESLMKRLSQKARACGIHLIIATQKPVVDVINTVVKSNLPATLALKVRTSKDSMVILDETGAEVLTGNGDALYKNGSGQVERVQCAIHV